MLLTGGKSKNRLAARLLLLFRDPDVCVQEKRLEEFIEKCWQCVPVGAFPGSLFVFIEHKCFCS